MQLEVSKVLLSVIIVNWNGADFLKRCLTQVFQTIKSIPFEVIVVDNASTDNSVCMLKEKYPGVALLENESNEGFARGNNQAFSQAHGEYCLMLNSDAFIHPNGVDKMIRIMQNNPSIGALGCRLENEDGTLQRSCYSFPTLLTELWAVVYLEKLFPRSTVFGKYNLTYWDCDDFREVDVVMGACLLLQKKALDQVGVLDEDYFMYSEEVDLCYRLKKSGWKVFFTPAATATHIWGGSSQKAPISSIIRLYRSRVLFFRKNYSWLYAFGYKILLTFSCLLRIVFGGLWGVITQKDAYRYLGRAYWHLLAVLWKF